jgi:peptide-methionine (S)-S-oxide reductase
MSEKREENATLGGGCFWCLEAAYDMLRGVTRVDSGYAGGHVPHPTYKDVCTGTTGHAEVVRITYDPDEISYGDLLDVFFTIHDPTTVDRQGDDIGPQYRSIILYENDDQRQQAGSILARLREEGVWDRPIMTQLEPLREFYPAEDYHRDYFERNGEQPYCRAVIAPKIAKLRAKAIERLKR